MAIRSFFLRCSIAYNPDCFPRPENLFPCCFIGNLGYHQGGRMCHRLWRRTNLTYTWLSSTNVVRYASPSLEPLVAGEARRADRRTCSCCLWLMATSVSTTKQPWNCSQCKFYGIRISILSHFLQAVSTSWLRTVISSYAYQKQRVVCDKGDSSIQKPRLVEGG